MMAKKPRKPATPRSAVPRKSTPRKRDAAAETAETAETERAGEQAADRIAAPSKQEPPAPETAAPEPQGPTVAGSAAESAEEPRGSHRSRDESRRVGPLLAAGFAAARRVGARVWQRIRAIRLRPRTWLGQVDRLVMLAVLSAVGLVWLVLVGFDAFTTFVGQIDEIGRGNYRLATAASFVLMTLPRRAWEMYGYAALLGSLVGLGQLAGSGELTALRAAGLSKLRICASVALSLVVLTAAVAVLGETIGPFGEQKAQALVIAAKSDGVTLASGGSLWARDGDAVINARRGRALPGTDGREIELSGVRVFEFDREGRLTALSLAATAIHAAGEWTLKDVRRTEFGKESARSTEFAQTSWLSGLDPRVLALSIVRPKYLAMRDLARNIAYLDRNHQDASVYRNAWWARVFYPVNLLVLVFCAVPFAFGALRSGGLSKRLFIGMLLVIGFYFLQRAIVNLGIVYELHPLAANLIPPALLIVMATAYFRRHA
jgi:lipopolysaccharide export system permease protein